MVAKNTEKSGTMVNLGLRVEYIEALDAFVLAERERTGYNVSRNAVVKSAIEEKLSRAGLLADLAAPKAAKVKKASKAKASKKAPKAKPATEENPGGDIAS